MISGLAIPLRTAIVMAMGMETAIGVLGGSFNPPHIGHIRLAEQIREQLGLVRVILIPAADPPHKDGARLASAAHRLAMTKLAVEGREGLEVSDMEIQRGGASYTVDTLRELHEGLSENEHLAFITGSDSLPDLPAWRDLPGILSFARLIVTNRPGHPMEEGKRTLIEGVGEDLAQRIIDDMVETEEIPVSATDIRQAIQEGQPWDGKVPEAVAEYIRENGLYRNKSVDSTVNKGE